MRVVLLIVALAVSACATARNDRHIVEQRRLEASVASLNAQLVHLRSELDAALAQNDSLGRSAARLSLDVLDREEQIRALRLELQRLKEIDLKPRQPRPN